jgi:hypothetical protein
MKTIKQIINRTTIILMVLFAMVVVNCSKDDGSDETPEDQIITFRVDLIKITGIETQGDGNDALEVYGDITAKLNFGTAFTEEILWSKSQENFVSIEVADFPIMTSKTFEVLESQLSNMSLDVNANLMERDGSNNPDDPLGNETLTTLLSGISSTGTYDVLMDESTAHVVQVSYSITRL